MKVMKTVPVPASKREVTDYYKCELCAETTSNHRDWEDKGPYNVNDPTVTLETGFHYPGDYSTKTTVLDICPKCFVEKLVPWFVAQGGDPREEGD